LTLDLTSRRSFVTISALTLAGCLKLLCAEKPAASSPAPKIQASEYWARRGDTRLYLYRKRMSLAPGGESKLPILFLAHGSSVSSRPTFDLNVPGPDEYSLMDYFARHGFDVWTMDFEGYGRSSPSRGNSNVADGVEDLNAATAVILKETGQASFFLYGESGGALRAGAFAMTEPSKVRGLLVSGFVWTGKGSPTLSKRAQDDEYYRAHSTRPRNREMIRSIFTRDKPGTSDPAVAEAMADEELKFGDSVPTGTYLDMTTRLPLVDPQKLTMPVQIIRGQYDGIASEEDIAEFFGKLATQDRQLIILAGAAHSLGLGRNRSQFWHAMRAFLDMPPRQDALEREGAKG
jgi:alpha-beta hydrolase superfamily lysophospholipase